MLRLRRLLLPPVRHQSSNARKEASESNVPAGIVPAAGIVPVAEIAQAAYTVLGWQVPDIAQAATELRDAGVDFQIYPGLGQDDLGVWSAPGGAKVAWFKDPDGHILSISYHPA